mgnify:FL=1
MGYKNLIFLLVIVLIVMPLVSADTITPGTKKINYCAKITNIDDFSEYVFLSYNFGHLAGGYSIIKQDACISSGYKFSSTRLYAIPKSKFNEEDIDFTIQWNKISEIERQEVRGGFGSIFDKFNGTNFVYDDGVGGEYEKEIASHIYFNYNDNLINLNTVIGRDYWVSIANPLTSVTESFTIVNIGDTLLLSKSVIKNYLGLTSLFYLLSIIAIIFIIYIVLTFTTH